MDRLFGGVEYIKFVVVKFLSVLFRFCDNVVGFLFIDFVLGFDVDVFFVCVRFFCVVFVIVFIVVLGNVFFGVVFGFIFVVIFDVVFEVDSVVVFVL